MNKLSLRESALDDPRRGIFMWVIQRDGAAKEAWDVFAPTNIKEILTSRVALLDYVMAPVIAVQLLRKLRWRQRPFHKIQEALSDAVLLQLAPPPRLEVGIIVFRKVYGLIFPLELPAGVRIVAELRASYTARWLIQRLFSK